ncbi:MAG TPA: hypothetical protein GX707_16360 [Epulopiscium sp.]|nr:hypothetical protein [Candidatus Epulonipiscium sp.]
MKKYWNKSYRHVPINLLLITIGIWGPTLVNVKNQYIIQILLVSSLMFIYTIFTNVNNSDVESVITQGNPQNRMVESQKIMLELSNSMIEVKSFKAIIGFDKELYNVKLEPEESYQWNATGGVFNGPIVIEDLAIFTSEKSICRRSFHTGLEATVMYTIFHYCEIAFSEAMDYK